MGAGIRIGGLGFSRPRIWPKARDVNFEEIGIEMCNFGEIRDQKSRMQNKKGSVM